MFNKKKLNMLHLNHTIQHFWAIVEELFIYIPSLISIEQFEDLDLKFESHRVKAKVFKAPIIISK